jgi:hypothetical protein
MADIRPDNIYNAGETIFQIGRATEPTVPVTANPGLPTSSNTKSRQWITSLECVSASGSQYNASIFVQDYKVEYNMLAVACDRRITHQAQFINAPAGRLTEDHGLDWLDRFDDRTTYRAPGGRSRLLLLKAHPAFLTFECLEFCERSRIILLCFPPDIGHLMHPLDVENFQDYKTLEPQHDCLEQEKKHWFYYH